MIACGRNQKPQGETRLRLIITCVGTGIASVPGDRKSRPYNSSSEGALKTRFVETKIAFIDVTCLLSY